MISFSMQITFAIFCPISRANNLVGSIWQTRIYSIISVTIS